MMIVTKLSQIRDFPNVKKTTKSPPHLLQPTLSIVVEIPNSPPSCQPHYYTKRKTQKHNVDLCRRTQKKTFEVT